MHVYIDEYSQRLIDECSGDGVKDISRFQSQCANMTFSDQSRYNRMFQQVVHKRGKSETIYIKIFQNTKALEILVENNYTEDQLMHTLLEN